MLLQYGKYRLNNNGTASLNVEYFDDDGTIVTDAWMPVTTFAWDTDLNKSQLTTDYLVANNNLTVVGNLYVVGV